MVVGILVVRNMVVVGNMVGVGNMEVVGNMVGVDNKEEVDMVVVGNKGEVGMVVVDNKGEVGMVQVQDILPPFSYPLVFYSGSWAWLQVSVISSTPPPRHHLATKILFL